MSEKQFEGKSAIVTGGTHGIGKAIALELAKRGCNVAFNYEKSMELGESRIINYFNKSYPPKKI